MKYIYQNTQTLKNSKESLLKKNVLHNYILFDNNTSILNNFKTNGLFTKLEAPRTFLPMSGGDLHKTFMDIKWLESFDTTKNKRSNTLTDRNIFMLSKKYLNNNKFSYAKIDETITAVRRYNINKCVVIPVDTPIHLICGSKDVIHS